MGTVVNGPALANLLGGIGGPGGGNCRSGGSSQGSVFPGGLADACSLSLAGGGGGGASMAAPGGNGGGYNSNYDPTPGIFGSGGGGGLSRNASYSGWSMGAPGGDGYVCITPLFAV